jgi:hypothetical protein
MGGTTVMFWLKLSSWPNSPIFSSILQPEHLSAEENWGQVAEWVLEGKRPFHPMWWFLQLRCCWNLGGEARPWNPVQPEPKGVASASGDPSRRGRRWCHPPSWLKWSVEIRGCLPLDKITTGHYKALFTSRIFEGMEENYFISWNFSNRLFTSPGFEGIISGYPTRPQISSVLVYFWLD